MALHTSRLLPRRPWTASSLPARDPLLGIGLGDSVGILGMRGTGKTHLGKRLYRSLLDAEPEAAGYVLDPNVAGDYAGWRGAWNERELPVIGSGQIVWQPPGDLDPDAYERFFERLYRVHRPAVVLLDEGNALGKGTHQMFAQLLKRGRARGHFKGVTVVSLWQELAQRADTPRQVFSQITHFIRFYTGHPYDLAEANRRMGLPAHMQPEHQHGFFHANMDKPPIKAVYYTGLG